MRTKIDRTLIDCMNNFPRTFNNEKTVNLIKRRFCETASQAGIDVPTYVVASTNPDFWDFRRMVQSMINLKFTQDKPRVYQSCSENNNLFRLG